MKNIINLKRRKFLLLLLAAVLIGILARVPGVWWGSNFPFGWYGHHPDEYTHALHAQLKINPWRSSFKMDKSIGFRDPWAAGYGVTPYPVAMAMHIAIPHIGSRILTSTMEFPPPPPGVIIPQGRMVAVAYGIATIILVFFLTRYLFSNPWAPPLAAWIMALGGLHVTQSHFFLSDVPALFWFLLGLLFLWRDQSATEQNNSINLAIAALSLGAAFGMKLLFAGIPSLGLVALLHKDRIWRVVLSMVFFLFGTFAVNAGMFTSADFYSVVFRGIADPFEFSILASFLLYIAELPSLISLPIFITSVFAIPLLAIKLLKTPDFFFKQRVFVILILPIGLHFLAVLFVLDHFPRHLLPFIPIMIICSAWLIAKIVTRLSASSKIWAPLAIAPFFLYLAVFVYDGEKGFIDDPRNKAAQWLIDNVEKGTTVDWYYHSLKDYKPVGYPIQRPDYIIEEMHHANHYLSGMGLFNSMPKDYRKIFDSHNQKYVDARQALFTGAAGYRQVASFDEGYFMPEFTLTDKIIGNRSRNYLAEVVVFKRIE